MDDEILRTVHEHLAGKIRDGRRVFIADPHVQTTAGGRLIVRLQEHYAGIPVFGGDLAVYLDDSVVTTEGDLLAFEVDGDGTPDLPAAEAVRTALRHFAPKSDRTACVVRHQSMRRAAAVPDVSVLASFPFPVRPTVFRIGRTDSSPAAYLVYHVANGVARLAWVVRMPFRAQSFLLIISAAGEDKGRILLCTRWSAGACFGAVFSFDHAAGRRRLAFPFTTADFPPFLPHANSAFLGSWVETNRMAGNSTITFDGNKANELKAVISGGVLEFPQFQLGSKEQTLLNAFFYCSFLHDFFLMLGFGEAEGNFQLKNFASSKGANDRLEVRVFQSKHPNLGDMDARDDGKTATLSLGLAPNKEPSGLHAELVIHEYAHGVVHRMVGGRLGALWLIQQQSLAMDEGWADYFAITLRNRYLGVNPKYEFADWANFPSVRSASYAPSVQRDYAKIKPPVTHAGEVFAAALIRFNERLGVMLGDTDKGHCIGWRAVVESLRLIKPNPHFLQGRDALLDGIGELEKGNVITPADAGKARQAAREAFAKYGMGANARSVNAAFGGITSDFNA